MNAAFAASNMVNQPQRPEGLLILRLRGLFLCGVLPCSRGCAGAEEASTASAAPIMECCKRTALSRPGRTTRLRAFSKLARTTEHYVAEKTTLGKKNGVKAQLAQADGDARKRRAAGFARCWPCMPRPCHAHRRRHKSGALSPRRSRRASLAAALLPAKGWSWPHHLHHALAGSRSLRNLCA